MLNYDIYVYSRNLTPPLGSLCFGVFMLIQSSKKGKVEKSKRANLNQRYLYAFLKEQPLLLSISWGPSSTHEMNKFLCTVLYKYINKEERIERLPMPRGEANNSTWVLSKIADNRAKFVFL